MTDSITSSHELRQFAAENSGRRKIDVEASIDLHTRAATELDALVEQLTDLQGRLAAAVTVQPDAATQTPATPVPAEDPSKAALILLQKAQVTADQTLAEADQVLTDAETTRQQADALVRAKVDAALAEARGQALHIIEEAESDAVHITDAAEAAAAEINATGHKAADRAAFIQRQTRDRTAKLRSDVEEMIDFARGMEALAADEAAAMIADAVTAVPPPQHAEPVSETVEPTPEPEVAAPPAPVIEQAPPPPVVEEVPEQAPVVLDAPPPPAAVIEDPIAATAEFRPPPPPANNEVVDLTDAELKSVLDGKSIDDELFDDDETIDLTDAPAASSNSGGFEFFGKD